MSAKKLPGSLIYNNNTTHTHIPKSHAPETCVFMFQRNTLGNSLFLHENISQNRVL